VRKALDGLGTVGAGYIPPVFSTYHWKPDATTEVKFDIAKANAILDEAGYKRGADGLRTMPDGTKPFKFRLLTHSTAPSESVLADHLKGWWKELGVELEVRNVSNDELTKQLYTGQYDIAVSSWGVNPDPDFILSLHICANLPEDTSGEGQDTDTFYCNKEYDDLYAAQGAETDPAKRAEIVKEMQKHLYVNAPVITLYYPNALEAYRSDRFTGFVQQPEGKGTITRQQGMWGYLNATPVAAQASTDSKQNSKTMLFGGLAVALLAGVTAVAMVVRRRRTADERE
jgi:peptide/nickel transport system substrate-binding protein